MHPDVRVGGRADGRLSRVPVRLRRAPSTTRGSRSSQPELFERITERVERGQWVPVGGMWVEADMNLPSGESLVRQIVFGQRYFEEKFGQRCEEVWIPDVFGYPAGLPQVFAAGGMTQVRHAEAVVEQAEQVPAQHVLVGGPRRHPGAHPLPAGRHLQRRDHPGRGAPTRSRNFQRPRLERVVADAVRARRRRRRTDPGDARAGPPAGDDRSAT